MTNQQINETDYIKDVVLEQWQKGTCVGDWVEVGAPVVDNVVYGAENVVFGSDNVIYGD